MPRMGSQPPVVVVQSPAPVEEQESHRAAPLESPWRPTEASTRCYKRNHGIAHPNLYKILGRSARAEVDAQAEVGQLLQPLRYDISYTHTHLRLNAI